MSTLVVRLSSLGDVVLAGSVTGALAPVSFLTSRRYLDIAAVLPGVERALAWEDNPPLRSEGYHQVIDLHASPRSRWLTRWMGAKCIARYDLRRRLRVVFKGPPAPSVLDRYAQAAGHASARRPWIDVSGSGDTLLLFPGAAHATKRWQAERFAEIRARWMDRGDKVLVIGSTAERDLCEAVASGEARVLTETGFAQTLAALGQGAAAMGADTGLCHLAAAAGIPTVVLFGPTTQVDGFWSEESCHPVSAALSCRPCSRYGGSACPVGDHACMAQLSVDLAWSTLVAACP
jgi:ADP-heptose:LPS heptosyltransferase